MPRAVLLGSGGRRAEIEIFRGETLMEAAKSAGVFGMTGACGGNCACGTCHVHIADPWVDRVGIPNTMEQDMLLTLRSADANSRLACQITMNERLDGLEVTVDPDN